MQYELAPTSSEEEDVSLLDNQMHPTLLVFNDSDAEARYSRYVYIKSGFYGGKLWIAAVLAINAFIWVAYHGLMQGWDPNSMFFSVGWVLTTVNTVVSIFTLIGLFVEKLFAYREALIVFTLAAHWPSICLFSFFGHKEPWRFRWMMLIGCVFFCAFHTQSRFSRIVWVIGLVPIITMSIAMLVTRDEYWDGLSYFEFWFWLLLLVPAFALRILERETRRAFLRMEACDNDIRVIERSIMKTQTLVVNFFARTPTRDFLSEGKEITRSRRYNEVAIVVTDLAGFTAWASRTETTVVVDHIAMMFARLDEFAVESGVEKVSSVGDSYQGIIFPHEHTEAATRAAAMLRFALSALRSSSALQLRVGAHFGNVTAAFIGSAPPKFDLFGEDFEIAKQLESGGVPGKVNASRALLTAASSLVEPAGALEDTALGVALAMLKDSTGAEISASEKAVRDGLKAHHSRHTPQDGSDDGHDESFSPFEIQQICKALKVLSRGSNNRAKRLRARPRRGSASQDSTSSSAGQPGKEGDGVLLMVPGNDDTASMRSGQGSQIMTADGGYSDLGTVSILTDVEEEAIAPVEESVKMNLLLRFEDPANEMLFMGTIHRSGIEKRMNNFLLGMQAAYLLAYYFLGCPDGTRNRLLVGCAVLSALFVALLAAKLQRPHIVATLIAYAIIPTCIGLSDTSCSATASHYLGSIYALMIINALLLINFWFSVPIYVRLIAIAFFTVVLGNVIQIVRIFALDDDHGWDPAFVILLIAFFLTGYTVDFTLRTSFAADRRLRLLERVTRSRFYQNTTVAMDVMLPQFVSNGLLNENGSKGVGTTKASLPDTAGDGERSSTRRRSIAITADVAHQGKRLWEFKNVCVMFATVNLSDEPSTHDDELMKLNGLFLDAEEILKTTNVQKIKTIGSTLMCVAGIPDGAANPSLAALHAAIPLVRRVLITSNRTYRIGLHVGPCFGAVLGESSLLFDVFGDTVNMASRMATTAPPNTIQVSDAVQRTCVHDGLFDFEAVGSVDVKGKGHVSTFRVVV